VDLLLLFYPSDLTAPNRSNHPPLVIPSAAEGPAVRPGSRTKFSILLVLPQNRHPERSASQSYRVIQRLWRGVEGPRRCLSYPCCSELFNHRARSGRPFGLCLGPRGWKMLKRFTVAIQCESQQILWSGFGGRKAPSSRGKISTAEVLRLGCAPPGFLLRSVALMHFMRLSLRKGAHAALSSATWQESGSG
jgi:hypothetical protein